MLDRAEIAALASELICLREPASVKAIEGRVINQNIFDCVDYLPRDFIDLLVIDPPYNLTKNFGEVKFAKTNIPDYQRWIDSWLSKLVPCLRRTASIYVCCDWQSSSAIQSVLEKYFTIRSRITWEREKGRGALSNWKNCSEDIWYCTMSDEFFFDVDAVKLRRKVIAPYRDSNGDPKDWTATNQGNFRLTHPSNLWTDISIPFWSMPENTDHPTQKPEKLFAKLILASSRPGEMVFDPFLGSGTTAVTAKKLKRRYAGVEMETDYCALALARLRRAADDATIQGYSDGVFWERNTPAKRIEP